MIRTLALLAAAQLGDIATTLYGFAHGTHESNGVALYVMVSGGLVAWAALKLWTVLAAWALVNLAPSPRARVLMLSAVRVAALMLFGVVAGNVLAVL